MNLMNTEPIGRASRMWGWLLMLSAIVLSPFYFYPSGLPQPGHVLMLIASIALIFLNRDYCIKMARNNLPGVLFLLLVLVINATYGVYYQDKGFAVATVYWGYGYLLLLGVMVVARDSWLSVWIARFIIFKLILIVVSYLVGWGNYLFWPRYQYFFNGPNQLAYFAICLFLVYLAVTEVKTTYMLFLSFFTMIFIVITTGGRSAYLALAPIVLLLLWMNRKNYIKSFLLIVIAGLTSLIFEPLCLPNFKPSENGNQFVGCRSEVKNTVALAQPSGAETRSIASVTFERINELSTKEKIDDQKSVGIQLFLRGYTRFFEEPKYIFYGAGQGKDDRFGDYHGFVFEMHSSLAAVLFYYGILGLMLFLAFIWKLFPIKYNLLFLSPLFVYGLFTYGLRAPYFWIALGFLALMPAVLSPNPDRLND
jgi:hypothetical protein